MLFKNKSIRTLILDHNKITDQGIRLIVDAVDCNPESKLEELSIIKNPIIQTPVFTNRPVFIISN
jgi:hypothetical protein